MSKSVLHNKVASPNTIIYLNIHVFLTHLVSKIFATKLLEKT